MIRVRPEVRGPMQPLEVASTPYPWIVNSNALGVGLLSKSNDFRISFLSRHAVRRLDEEGILGRNAADLLNEPATELGDSPYFQTDHLNDPSNYPVVVQQSFGDRTIEYAISPVIDGDGEYIGVMLTFKDVSDAIQRDHAASEFAADVSQLIETARRRGDEAENATEHLLEVVEAVQASGSKIQVLLERLNQMNNKTHMLSLNANIEASRSGKMAAAFDIIAQEMRQLAKTMGGVTEEVDALATALQKDGDLASSTSTIVSSTVGDLIELQRSMEERVLTDGAD